MNAVGLRRDQVSTPSQNRGNVVNLSLAHGAKTGVALLSATTTVVYFTGPLESGSWRDTDVTLLPSLLFPGSEELLPGGQGRAVHLSAFAVLWERPSPWALEGHSLPRG